MRKIISLSFIVILLINLFGYFISFTVQRYKVREEVRQLMKEEKMMRAQQFVFTEQEYRQLNKIENGKEFILSDGIYDVVRKEVKNGKILLTAFYDHKETGLLGRLVSYFTDETQSEKGKHTLPFFSLLEFVFYVGQLKYFDSIACVDLHSYSDNLLTLSLNSASPPPDLLFS